MICYCGLVLGVHGVCATYHEDKVEVQTEVLEAIADLIKVTRRGAGNHRQLDAIDLDLTELLELFHFGKNN